MDFMERGLAGGEMIGTGWLARHLNSVDNGSVAPLRAIGWGKALQRSLKGGINAASVDSILKFHLQGRQEVLPEILATLNALYAADAAELKSAANFTNDILELVSKVNVAAYKPANGATYVDDNDFDMALMQTAALIKADVGLEISAIDLGGWDTHKTQAPDLQKGLTEVARGLSNFYTDLGDGMKNVTVLVMSEFGRRVEENASGGTDHGYGNMMLVMGGNVADKPVLTEWPGLQPEQLVKGDLAITIDYRDVLSEILTKRMNNPHTDVVFPNFQATMRGVVR
jgi:uncharacterized protein (DUF1501 family)